MNKEEKLKLVIDKAIDNGWMNATGCRFIASDGRLPDMWVIEADKDYGFCSTQRLLFDHDFAKAFWGEEDTAIGFITNGGYTMPNKWVKNWQHHLQQAVLEEDPLEYYFKHL